MLDQLVIDYHSWMMQIVNPPNDYKILMRFLNRIEFYFILPMDENRYVDGVDLRYRFGYEFHIPDEVIREKIDIYPPSVLEVMVALAFRMEETIMEDLEKGSRTPLWFWKMIETMGLSLYDDKHWNEHEVYTIVKRFLDRDYSPSGMGGLFSINDPSIDMRNVDIWYQMSYFLKESE